MNTGTVVFFYGLFSLVGGVIGFLGGLAVGATAGAVAGKAVDEYILDNYKCNACEHTFSS